jgi:hypothetical protein
VHTSLRQIDRIAAAATAPAAVIAAVVNAAATAILGVLLFQRVRRIP